MNAVEDLAGWLTAVWDEEEKRELAKRAWRTEAPPMDVTYDDGGVYVSNPGSRIRHWLSAEDYDRSYLTPAPDKQVLARIAADRKILAEFVARDKDVDLMLGPDCLRQREWSGLRLALWLKAEQYKDRPGFNPHWLDEHLGSRSHP